MGNQLAEETNKLKTKPHRGNCKYLKKEAQKKVMVFFI